MYPILISTIIVSVLHALIPSHWLPLLTIAKSRGWTNKETLTVTFYMGAAHVLSTIVLGILLSLLGSTLHHQQEEIFEIVAPVILILFGLFFIYRHYTHHHFHLNKNATNNNLSKSKLINGLVLLMFLSPCLEVEAFFLKAGEYGFGYVLLIAVLYGVISIVGMLLWVNVALHGLKKLNWHKIEHNAGLITGFVLILCGIFTYFVH